MSRNDTAAHDPSAPSGHLPGFAREERGTAEAIAFVVSAFLRIEVSLPDISGAP
ncbi:hypothetical protein BH10PSE6_BH10PSE6_48460 [soil metagenome]